jgi:hypothetical protein
MPKGRAYQNDYYYNNGRIRRKARMSISSGSLTAHTSQGLLSECTPAQLALMLWLDLVI